MFFAGQITGVEGYLESAGSGLVAAVNMMRLLEGKPLLDFTAETALGALSNYISTPNNHFQPMNVNFGIMESWPQKVRKKKEKNALIANRALEEIDALKAKENL